MYFISLCRSLGLLSRSTFSLGSGSSNFLIPGSMVVFIGYVGRDDYNPLGVLLNAFAPFFWILDVPHSPCNLAGFTVTTSKPQVGD